MDLPGQVLRILHEAIAQDTGSAAALVVQAPDLQLNLAVGRTSRLRRVHLRGRGWRDEPLPGTPVGPATRFDLASLTKPMATLTLLAQELSRPQPRLHLDDRLEEHLPAARGTVLGPTPLRQLMGHASGAAAWLDFYGPTEGLHDPAERRVAVQRQVLDTPLERDPGQHAVYSDLGFLALGWLLEALDGEPLDLRFARDVARPLGLDAGYRRLSKPLPPTDLAVTEIWPPRCPDGLPLQGQVHDDNAAALDGVAGHAGLFASAASVGTWAAAWLAAVRGGPDDDRPQGPLALAPAVAHRLISTQAAREPTTWRLGWDTPTRPGSSAGDAVPQGAFGHLGFTGTSVWLAPQQATVVVLLTNRVHPDRATVEGIRRLRPRLHDLIWSAATSPLR